METEPFRAGVDRLRHLAEKTGPTAIMCAEALWWRCHRALISDFVKVRGVEVIHIIDPKKNQLHPFTSAARVVDNQLTYNAGDAPLF